MFKLIVNLYKSFNEWLEAVNKEVEFRNTPEYIQARKAEQEEAFNIRREDLIKRTEELAIKQAKFNTKYLS